MRFAIIAASLTTLLLAGCSDKKEEKPEGVIPQYQMQAMDKAKGVEQTLQQAAEQRQEESEQY